MHRVNVVKTVFAYPVVELQAEPLAGLERVRALGIRDLKALDNRGNGSDGDDDRLEEEHGEDGMKKSETRS